MESFENKEIIFYTLILNEEESQKIQEFPEILEDFLEDKICSLLNLLRDCEYFLRFYTQDSKTYHCLLLNKNSLKNYVKNAESYLSHPCFLCAQFLQEDRDLELQAFLVLDSYAQWTLIGYQKGEIVFLQPIKDLKMAEDKIKILSQKARNFYLSFWVIHPNSPMQKIKVLQSQFNAQILHYSLKEVNLLDSFNFNPLEKTLPLRERTIGKMLRFAVFGALVGIGIWIVLLIFHLLESREIHRLQSQIESQKTKLHHQKQSYTQSQKEALFLQEKLESLQSHYNRNAQFLKDSMPNTIQLTHIFRLVNPFLQQYHVKIAYFGLDEKGLLNLLLRGEKTLQVLEGLEKSKLGNVQNLKKYQDFYWIQIALGIPQ